MKQDLSAPAVATHVENPAADPVVAPPWSPDNRLRIQRAMNAVLREAADLVLRRTSGGQWWPPAETEAGDVSGLILTARHLVLAPLEEVLKDARATLDDVERQVREYRGLSRPDERGEP
ncbi:hypothetical protein BGM19_34330 [Streptomyces agglomeratus]|uniref:hypothetical protein n=1 Tax=Streptomyces agglomeratus TaxID=285458 RepID=UPI000868CA97|nr:hypothetical protein [Streptomyces agglomeratus]OEJ62339.1 hypothetical protein BGM19_34330 [Streptomyces agglomeratus]